MVKGLDGRMYIAFIFPSVSDPTSIPLPTFNLHRRDVSEELHRDMPGKRRVIVAIMGRLGQEELVPSLFILGCELNHFARSNRQVFRWSAKRRLEKIDCHLLMT